jgi:putative ABC transport system ATP-binding protein
MPEKAPLVLSIRSLRKDRAAAREEIYSLRAPALDVRLGDKLLITGPSGAGKSTLLDMIGMILKPDGAESFLFHPGARADRKIRQHRRDIPPDADSLPRNAPCDVAAAWRNGAGERIALWRRNLGYVPQSGGLLPFLSVRENILTPLKLRGTEKSAFAGVNGLADTLGIRHLLPALPGRLSVGERQRAAIARALAADPALVLADEPTAALDPHNAARVLELFSRMVSDRGVTLIMVTHAPENLRGMGFRRLALVPAKTDSARGAVMELRPAGDV